MDILLALGRTLLVCAIGMFLAYRFNHTKNSLFTINKPMKRSYFIPLYIILLIVLYSIDGLYNAMLNIIVNLPAYWGLRLSIGVLYILVFPFLYTVLSRRFTDLRMPAFFGIVFGVYIIFNHVYNAVIGTAFILNVTQMLISIPLIFVPSMVQRKKDHHKG